MRGQRARVATVAGWAVVLLYAAVALWVTADTGARRADGAERPAVGAEAAARFVEAWERSRTGTFVTSGTVERTSGVIDGAVLRSDDVVAQRPPRRLHRAHGGVDGRHDDRLLLCPGARDGSTGPCELGRPGGPSYAESVAAEVGALADLVAGPERLYDVVADGAGCFDLSIRRVEPRAPYGVGARLCFDAVTGAPTFREVRHEGGVVETLVVTELRAEVTDADLEP